jgi:tetratricopeptide (TPR) repeat protein
MKACQSRREMTQEGVKRAVAIIEAVLQEHPTPVGYYLLAEAYLNLTPANNEVKIVKAYRDAISLSPKF